MLSDEQASKTWPFSLLNDEQMSNWVGVKHLPGRYDRHSGSHKVWINMEFLGDSTVFCCKKPLRYLNLRTIPREFDDFFSNPHARRVANLPLKRTDMEKKNTTLSYWRRSISNQHPAHCLIGGKVSRININCKPFPVPTMFLSHVFLLQPHLLLEEQMPLSSARYCYCYLLYSRHRSQKVIPVKHGVLSSPCRAVNLDEQD